MASAPTAHATAYYLANAGQDTRAIQMYLGHKSIQHTTKYTDLATARFNDFWLTRARAREGRLHPLFVDSACPRLGSGKLAAQTDSPVPTDPFNYSLCPNKPA
jgi:hypothetical protein